MARPYSEDLRTRVLAACDAGQESISAIARRFVVDRTTVHGWLRARAQEGRTTAKPHAGGPASKLSAETRQWLASQVEVENDLTLEEYAQRLAQERGVRVVPSTLSRALKRMDLPRKKRR
ncbi:MAG TPA: IS630 transposase-related protein [Myxococcaceae bacterium]|nr:IS630 transposase-related protein [Myxococcaceae bacterium]